MSDEVTLIQAWIAQGQQTDDGGIPIPPVMPEPTLAGGDNIDIAAMVELIEMGATVTIPAEVAAKVLQEKTRRSTGSTTGTITGVVPGWDEPTPTGEPTESWEAWARREAPGDDSGECNEVTLRVRFEIALRNLGYLRKESEDRRLPEPTPLPEGARWEDGFVVTKNDARYGWTTDHRGEPAFTVPGVCIGGSHIDAMVCAFNSKRAVLSRAKA